MEEASQLLAVACQDLLVPRGEENLGGGNEFAALEADTSPVLTTEKISALQGLPVPTAADQIVVFRSRRSASPPFGPYTLPLLPSNFQARPSFEVFICIVDQDCTFMLWPHIELLFSHP